MQYVTKQFDPSHFKVIFTSQLLKLERVNRSSPPRSLPPSLSPLSPLLTSLPPPAPSLLPLGEPRGQAQRYKRKLRSNERTALLAAERARDGRESIEREERSIRQPKSGGRSGKMKQQCLQGPEIRLVRGCKRFIHRPS